MIYLVIAASSGIGQEVVKKIKSDGGNVITTARNNSKINPDYILDASDFNAVSEIFSKIGRIDGVVNCSGSLLIKPAHLTSFEEYIETINSSLTTAFATTRAAGKYMKSGGSVVLISSAAAEYGLACHEAIAAAKSGIEGLVRAAAATYASINLRFNAVAPGLTDTNLIKNIKNDEQILKISQSLHPLNRLGKPQEIANLITFLLNPENSWITGQSISIDGGLSKVHAKSKL